MSHLPIFSGFVLLFVTTTCVAAGVYLFHQETPYSLYNPIKWIGNVGAIVLILGALLAVFNRLSQQEEFGKGTYFDWLFLLVVLATGVTGLLTEVSVSPDAPDVAYPVYFIHLVFVWFLFAYLPFLEICPSPVPDNCACVRPVYREEAEKGICHPISFAAIRPPGTEVEAGG